MREPHLVLPAEVRKVQHPAPEADARLAESVAYPVRRLARVVSRRWDAAVSHRERPVQPAVRSADAVPVLPMVQAVSRRRTEQVLRLVREVVEVQDVQTAAEVARSSVQAR